MDCQGCGRTVDPSENFCRECGTELTEDPDGSAQDADPGSEGPVDAANLVAGARHESVTVDRLTECKPGLTTRYLHDEPLVEYLDPGEQPHFVLAARNNAPDITGALADSAPERDGTGMAMHLVTDRRWLIVAANQDGDQSLGIPLDDLRGFDSSSSLMGTHTVTLWTEDSKVEIPIANLYDEADIDAVVAYLDAVCPNAAKDGPAAASAGEQTRETDEGTEATGGYLNSHLEAETQGAYVTAQRVEKIQDALESDERVHYMWRGGTIDVEGSGAGESLWGNDRDRKSGTRGFIRTAVTDRRVVIHIPQFLGDDERTVPYRSISSIDLDTGVLNKRVSLQTKGQTYHIQASEPDKDEIKAALRFIRDKMEEAHQPQATAESGPDPTEQLKNLKELHDEGVLSDEEFEEKKDSLLDEI